MSRSKVRMFRGAQTRNWAIVISIAWLTALSSSATIVNETFDAGTIGWTTSGDVGGTTDAYLGDTNTDYSLLYQGFAIAPGTYRIEFDYLNVMSSEVPADLAAFPDVFFASLYFTNDLGTFDLAGNVYDDVDFLLDLDSTGAYNVAGTLSPSALGGNWTHFSYDFTNSYAYVIPLFELFDFNTITSDSQTRLDNVMICQTTQVVPEPATLTLSLLGLLGCVVTRRNKK